MKLSVGAGYLKCCCLQVQSEHAKLELAFSYTPAYRALLEPGAECCWELGLHSVSFLKSGRQNRLTNENSLQSLVRV